MHSLRKHRQQLASCATLWRFFQAAIASVSFPFCCCLFSLYVKRKKKWWKRSERARHNTQLQLPERKIECWEMKLWKIKLLYTTFLKHRARSHCKQISSFPKPFSRFFYFRVQFILKWKGDGPRIVCRMCRRRLCKWDASQHIAQEKRKLIQGERNSSSRWARNRRFKSVDGVYLLG